MKSLIFRLLAIFFLVLCAHNGIAQFLMDKLDTTRELAIGYKDYQPKLDHIRISGYIQPQFQKASAKGINSFSGGDFAPNTDSRFMLRRGRIKFEYMRTDYEHRPVVQFVFQFDGTERGVFIRDFWGRVWEHKLDVFALTTGMMARPFGFEANYSSGAREAPERGRMSQTLMKAERDLGAMLSAESPGKSHSFINQFRIDAGIYNGQGVNASGEYDSYKDFITQLVWKPTVIAKNLSAAGGVSLLYGGIAQTINIAYRMTDKSGIIDFAPDSTTTHNGDKLPRTYYGANARLRYMTSWGATELRGEYWSGTQTAYKGTSETPGTQPLDNVGKFIPMYIRPFSGGFIVFLQNIVNANHQVGVKYDWYDPNTKVAGKQLGMNNSFTQADIKYGTLGFGYIYNMSYNFKVTFWYDRVKNENTSIPGYEKDVDDNVFTCRLQFTF